MIDRKEDPNAEGYHPERVVPFLLVCCFITLAAIIILLFVATS